MKGPKYIYRYTSLSQLNLLNLKKNQLFFASSDNFNDPYDSFPEAKMKQPTLMELKKLKELFIQDMTKKGLDSSVIEVLSPKKIKDLISNSFEKAKSEFRNKWGIVCLSQVNDNLLMWSHYADGHKGICIKFNTKFEPFNKLHKVDYSSKLPSLNPYDVLSYETDRVMKLFCTKSNCWEYEKEWRIFHKEINQEFYYSNDAIEAVYFGAKVDVAMVDIVCTLMVNQHPNIKFYHSKLGEDIYKVKFEEFQYIPHLDAKNKGMID